MAIDYRREIDGLRAIAVLPVVFNHAGFDLFKGGFIGVDIFFVISGFLITSILLTDLDTQRFSLLRFYDRRMRRILPALFLVIAACFIFGYLWMPSIQLREFSRSVVAVNLFISNFFFMDGNGYFDTAQHLRPLLHTWSLAIEEQFYLVFPPILYLSWKFAPRLLVPILFGAAVASLATAQLLGPNTPNVNYFSPFSRAWELIVGSLLAIAVKKEVCFKERWNNSLSAVGLVTILFSINFVDSRFTYPGLWTLLPVVGTALVIAFGNRNTLVGRVLSFKPLVVVGLISYSMYLWHQPVFVFARFRFGEENLNAIAYLFLIVITGALAYGSYSFIEQPIRRKWRSTRGSLTILATLFICFAVLIAGARFTKIQGRSTLPFRPPEISELDAKLSMNLGLSGSCDQTNPVPEICMTEPTPLVAVWGDSLAMHTALAVKKSDPNASIVQLTRTNCSPIIGYAAIGTNIADRIHAKGCNDFNKRVQRWLTQTPSIKYVALVSIFNRWNSPSLALTEKEETVASSLLLLSTELKNTVTWLRENNLVPVLITPPPIDGRDIGICYFRSVMFGSPISECTIQRLDAESFQKEINEIFQSLEDEISILWLDETFCDTETCSVTDGEKLLYNDRIHLSYDGSEFLGQHRNLYKEILKSH
ncbi:MAG: acyltransferase [Rhodobacteraceae bacterium]|nr:acyltransferase [Paracoccaceae bacterium]